MQFWELTEFVISIAQQDMVDCCEKKVMVGPATFFQVSNEAMMMISSVGPIKTVLQNGVIVTTESIIAIGTHNANEIVLLSYNWKQNKKLGKK